ncbi:MAG: hypothetical protein RSA27_03925, partial [Oscillospiraceae bacterium]
MMKNVIKRVLLTVMAIAVIFSSLGSLAFAQSKSITVMTNSTTVTNYETLTINEHGIESGSPGNATFTFMVETAGYYDMYMNMGFYWNISEVAGGNVGCNVDISLDSTERIYLSNENLEDLGVLTQMWHKNRFCYKTPVYLSVGQHTMTFTASERSGYANEFQLERFELVKNESILASPVPIKMITNKENAYSYSGLEFDNTSVATGNTGYVTYKFDVAQAAIYDLYMDMGFYMNLEASGDVGCDVSIQFDNETSNKLSEGNTVSVGVLSNAWHKNRFLYKKSVYLAQGNHSLTFTTTARSNKFSEFQLARFMLQASSKPAAIEVKTNAENVVSSKGFTVGVNGIETLDLGS